jgi:hypothetical protein
VIVRRKSLAGRSMKNVDILVAVHQTVPPAVIASAPPSMSVIGSMILSTAEA